MQPLTAALSRTDLETPAAPLSLEYLIAPVTRRQFIDRFWGQGHLFVHRERPTHFSSLFTLSDVDRWMMPSQVDEGRRITVVAAKGSDRASMETTTASTPQEILYQRFDAGDTLRLLGVEKSWPSVATLVASLAEELNVKATVNAYLTPAHSQGLAAHFDYTDVFILQVEGAKEWFVYEPGFRSPLETDYGRTIDAAAHDESTLVLRECERLETGDVLYIPRGFYHKAITSDACSLHLTVSLHPIYWVDFLKRSVELLCAENVELREALPPDFVQANGIRAEMDETFDALLQLVREKASFEATLGSFIEQLTTSRRFPPDGHFTALAQLSTLGLDATVERRLGLPCLVESTDRGAVLRFGPHRVQGPATLLPALEFIRDHRRFQVAELPAALSDSSKLVLVRRLIRDGLLRPTG
ncbi:MAG TPA: cupin domain-containing protein [Thermoanaerobaculia bacterium]|nr:cupin domain-containing protein [Thermoanaerobaculia bacterium]